MTVPCEFSFPDHGEKMIMEIYDTWADPGGFLRGFDLIKLLYLLYVF